MSKLTVSVERELLERFVNGSATWIERRELRLILEKTKFLTTPEPVAIVTGSSVQWLPGAGKIPDRSPLYVEQPVASIVLPERKPQDLANEFQLAEEWHEETGYNQALNDVIRLNGL